ncbi:hemin receptor [Paremcibacter congregatus]|uniref:hemin receptor n=1 Tax=Paremcibacter congregatus TaxID=2043170 RepID=UPI003A8FBBA0
MDDEFDLPPGIGPHNDRELELMLAGTKPMAMFSDAVHVSDYFPDADFAPHVETGKIIRVEEIIPDEPYDIRYLFFALPGEEWRIEEALILCRNLRARTVKDHDADSARMGELLGYRAEDIEAFIEHSRR